MLIESGNENSEHHLNISSYKWQSKSKMPKGVHMVGGGTTKWHGRLSKLPKDIFNVNEKNELLKWPINYLEFERYYLELLKFLEIENAEYKNEVLNRFHSCKFCENIIEISPFQTIRPTRFIEIFSEIVKHSNFKYLPNTFCESLSRESSDKIKLRILNVNNQIEELLSNYVFVSCGAIQSAALVQRSFPEKQKYLPIGCFLMEHFDGFVGNLILRKGNFRCLQKYVSNKWERTLYLNYGAGIYKKRDNSLSYHLEFVKYRRTYIFDPKLNQFNLQNKLLLKIFFQIERFVTFLPNRIWRNFHKLIGNEIYSIWLKGEELPFKESKINISSHENKEVIYNHKISKETRILITKSIKDFSKELMKSNLGFMKLHLKVLYWRMFQTGGNFHPMGTLRMHDDPDLSVVDLNHNLVFDDRIFIIDASVFPSGGNQNPTINALTLTFRAIYKFIERQKYMYEEIDFQKIVLSSGKNLER